MKTYWTLTLANEKGESVEQWKIRKPAMTEEERESPDADWWMSVEDLVDPKHPRFRRLTGVEMVSTIINRYQRFAEPVCQKCGDAVLEYQGEDGASGHGKYYKCPDCGASYVNVGTTGGVYLTDDIDPQYLGGNYRYVDPDGDCPPDCVDDEMAGDSNLGR